MIEKLVYTVAFHCNFSFCISLFLSLKSIISKHNNKKVVCLIILTLLVSETPAVKSPGLSCLSTVNGKIAMGVNDLLIRVVLSVL